MKFWWQSIPSLIDPIAFSIGPVPIRWYGLLFFLGLAFSFFLLHLFSRSGRIAIRGSDVVDMTLAAFLGVLVGGRLGYAAFYNQALLLDPIALISPFDASGQWVGIWGMSFFGALVGVASVLAAFCRIRKLDLFEAADALSLVAPVGLFFGRLGNFVNGELFGRVTDAFWGMRFPLDPSGFLRHPSQLYEAFLEGPILLLVLFFVRERVPRKGTIFVCFFFGYAFFRFFSEFFREPGPGERIFFGWMTTGQVLSLGLAVIAVGFILARKYAIMARKGK